MVSKSTPSPPGRNEEGLFQQTWEFLDTVDRLGLIMSLPALGLAAGLVQLLKASGPPTGEGLVPFWRVLIQTAPLSFSAAFITTALFRKWFSMWVILVPFAAAWLGVRYGDDQFRHHFGPLLQNLDLRGLVRQYWLLYGWMKFSFSIAAGFVVGRFWGQRILPRLDQTGQRRRTSREHDYVPERK